MALRLSSVLSRCGFASQICSAGKSLASGAGRQFCEKAAAAALPGSSLPFPSAALNPAAASAGTNVCPRRSNDQPRRNATCHPETVRSRRVDPFATPDCQTRRGQTRAPAQRGERERLRANFSDDELSEFRATCCFQNARRRLIATA